MSLPLSRRESISVMPHNVPWAGRFYCMVVLRALVAHLGAPVIQAREHLRDNQLSVRNVLTLVEIQLMILILASVEISLILRL